MASIELRAAAQQALEACKLIVSAFDALKPASDARNEPLQINAARASITALEAALAEPVQEPVAWTLTKTLTKRETTTNGYLWFSDPVNSSWTPLYAHPPQRPAEPVQEPAKPDHETRAEIAEQQVVQLAEERDHYRNLWLKAKQAEPAQEPVAYSVGRTLHWHEGKGVNDAQMYLAPPQRKPLTEEEEIERIRAAERERLIRAVESVPPHRWVDGSDQWGNPCPAKVVATKSDYVAAMRAADKRNVPTLAEPVQEPVQEPFALPCPTPKACKAHCCSGHCVPRTNHQNDMTRIPPMLCIPHRIPDCPKCMSTHTFPPQRKPLTDEEIDEVWNSLIATPDFSRVKIARAIERAHGIGGQP